MGKFWDRHWLTKRNKNYTHWFCTKSRIIWDTPNDFGAKLWFHREVLKTYLIHFDDLKNFLSRKLHHWGSQKYQNWKQFWDDLEYHFCRNEEFFIFLQWKRIGGSRSVLITTGTNRKSDHIKDKTYPHHGHMKLIVDHSDFGFEVTCCDFKSKIRVI